MTKGSNVEVQRRSVSAEGSCAVVGAISAQRGLIATTYRARSIKQDDFIEFLAELRSLSSDRQLHVVLDNCAVHHAKRVVAFAAEMKIELIYLRPYSPEHNPIELVWAQAKREYKKLLLEAYLSKLSKPIYLRELVAPALLKVTKANITGFVEKATKEIFVS
jgi:transposase